MILALINKGIGTYGQGGTALAATDFMVFGGATAEGGTAETDPTVPSHVKNITAGEITNWNSAYGWGNHAGQYRSATWVPQWSEVQNKPLFTRTVAGLVPPSGGSGTDRFLREDGNWAIPSGTGGTGDSTPTHVNQITQTQINNWDNAWGWGNHTDMNYTTFNTIAGNFVRRRNELINPSNGSRTWENSVYGFFMGITTNTQYSTGFPSEYGITYTFGYGQNASVNIGDRGRDFDIYKRQGYDRFGIRGYSTSSGNPLAWKNIVISPSIREIWVGTSAQLPSQREADILYFVTD